MSTRSSSLASLVILAALVGLPMVPAVCEVRHVSAPPAIASTAIDCPQRIETGELVVAKAAVQAGGYAWTLIPERSYMIGDGGRSIAFTSGRRPGSIVVILGTAKADTPAIYQHTLTVSDEPAPDPKPDPTPQPGPLHCLFLYESDDLDTMPPAQAAIVTSKPIRDYLTAKCDKEAGVPAFRFLDKDADTKRLAKDWQDVMARGRGKTLPWAIVTNGKDTFEGPWPADAAKMLDLLQKYGGK